MSTYYYALCDAHKAVSQVIAGRSFPDNWWQNDQNELADFIQAHSGCKLLIVDEHDDRTIDYEQMAAPTGEEG